jgi:hypothetical protein
MAAAKNASAVLLAGLIVGLVSGLALGVLWWQLAPKVPLLVRPDTGAYPEGFQPEGFVAQDVTFAALAFVAGIAVTIGLAYMRRENLGVVLVAALLASAVGTVAMWFVGTHLGSVDIEGLVATTREDTVVDAPLKVSMPAMYLVWAIAAALVVTVLALSDWLGGRIAARKAAAAAESGS